MISGSAVVGQTLTASTGTWAGSPTRFAYEFMECAGICSPGGSYSVLSVQSTNTYTVKPCDGGHEIYVAVQASNAYGSAVAVSMPTPYIAVSGSCGAAARAKSALPGAAFTISSPGGRTATFDASISSAEQPATRIVAYAWSFGDGKTGTGRRVRHTYAKAGIYTVRLTVTDNRGRSASSTKITSIR